MDMRWLDKRERESHVAPDGNLDERPTLAAFCRDSVTSKEPAKLCPSKQRSRVSSGFDNRSLPFLIAPKMAIRGI